jgi:TolB-like protein/Tfp pilus assembly protein PilF/predicted Ser/Thr protein kinase
MIGQTISHYKILSKLGEGGMGVVYKAHDTTLDRDVALKFLSPHLTSDPNEKERFYHEARAAAALMHQNIAVIHEIGEHENQLFIAMEFVEGTTLKQLVGSDTLSVKKVLDIAIQVCGGLGVAHEKGIVHRDIKSDNIIVTAKGQAKIMDFGLAKVRGATKLTQAGSTPGTAAYMSPEQAQGEEVDHRSDIFSFGVVLYELLTSKLPFRGEHEAALMYSIINQEPAPIARFNEKAGDDLQRIVSKALAKDREERYQHIDDMLADLKRERRALESARTGRVEIPGVPPTARAEEPGVLAKPKRRVSRYLIPAGIVGIAVLLVLVFNPFGIQVTQKKTAAADRKSVAVLPFTNMSGDKEDEFFSDGVTEDIITQLSNIGELKVISRTSVMQYKNTTKNLRDIAKELNVATVLEGSVRRAGNQVRIAAQLIDATNDEHIWAQTYDKEMTQIFAIQSDVAQQIASALKAKLSPREKEHIAKKPTDNLDAYAYYLKGREYYYRYTRQDNESAIDLFKKALSLDPNYALAYAGLGDAYGQRSASWASDSSIAASKKAISIDPNLAEGYKALGLAYAGKGWIRKSLEAYEKAIEINPNYGPALGNMGSDNYFLGRFDEALIWHKRAAASNPMFALHYGGIGSDYAALGDDAKAMEWSNKAIALQPDVAALRADLCWTYLRRSEYQQAIDQVRKALSRQPDDADCLVVAGIAELLMGNYTEAERDFEKGIAIDSVTGPTTQLGYVCWKTGRKDQARKLFARSLTHDREQLEQGSEHWGVPYDVACISAIQGDTAEAFAWLQKAIDAGSRDYRSMQIDPFLENLRGDDRFKQMMAVVKTQVSEMRKRVEEAERKEADSGNTR